MLNKLRSVFNDQQFRPSWWGLLINPFYIARKGLYNHIRSLGSLIVGNVLDVGCGQKPYQSLFAATTYVGLEIDSPESRKRKTADFFYDGTIFPFRNAEFNCVVANQVFEHVFNPQAFLLEVHRVLKSDGLFLLTVPFVWDEHEQPNDFARYSSFGLQSLLESHGFSIVLHKRSVNNFAAIFQLMNVYLYKVMFTGNKYVDLILTILFMAPVTFLGTVLGSVMPASNDLYLDNIILAKKVSRD